MRDSVDFEVHERFEILVVRTLAAVERTNAILGSARKRVTLSGGWPSGARHTRRHAVASIASVMRSPLASRGYLVDQAPNTPPRGPRHGFAVALTTDVQPATPTRSDLQQQIAALLARVAVLAEGVSDEALRDRLAVADAAARDTRHWLLDEPRHTPESLLDIEASVGAIAKLLDEIEDHR